MSFVKTNRPRSGRPSAHERASRTQGSNMGDECSTDALALIAGAHVGVPDEIDIANGLHTHHTNDFALVLISPKNNTRVNLRIKLLQAHIGLVPSVGRYYTAICFRREIDNVEN